MINFLNTLQSWGRTFSDWLWNHLEWTNVVAGVWALAYLIWSISDSIQKSYETNDPIPWYLIVAYVFFFGIAFANFYMAWKVRVTRSGRSVRWDVCRECDHLKEMHVNGISNWSEYTGVTKDVLRCAVMTQMKFTVPYHFQSCQCEQYRRRWVPMAWPARESVR